MGTGPSSPSSSTISLPESSPRNPSWSKWRTISVSDRNPNQFQGPVSASVYRATSQGRSFRVTGRSRTSATAGRLPGYPAPGRRRRWGLPPAVRGMDGTITSSRGSFGAASSARATAQGPLHLGRADLDAAGGDDVAEAVDDPEPAAGRRIEPPDVAGAVPAGGGEGSGGAFGPEPVAPHEHRRPDEDLAGLAPGGRAVEA